MADLHLTFDNDFIKELEALSDYDTIAPKMINEALPILKKEVKRRISASHTDTGNLEKKIGIKKAKKMKGGGYVGHVVPKGNQEDGTRNAEVMVYLEYGTTEQAASHILGSSASSVENQVLNKLQEVYERETKK